MLIIYYLSLIVNLAAIWFFMNTKFREGRNEFALMLLLYLPAVVLNTSLIFLNSFMSFYLTFVGLKADPFGINLAVNILGSFISMIGSSLVFLVSSTFYYVRGKNG